MALPLRAFVLALGLSAGALIGDSVMAGRAAAELLGDASVHTPREQARRAQVLAKGDGFSITVGALEDQINKQPAGMRARYLGREERKALLDSLVRLELLGREALARGLAENSAVRQTVKDGAVQTLVRTEIDEKVTAEAIRAEDIAAFYAAHPEEFHHPAERRASHIAVDSRAAALALIEQAKQTDLRGFAELARKHSLDEETKLRGGDLAFFTRDKSRDSSMRQVPDALREAVFALKESGEVGSEPVAVEGRFSIVRLTGERPERHVTQSDAESSIRGRLWREQRHAAVAALIDRLRMQQKPKIFAERVDLVKFDDMEKRPSGFLPDPPANAASKDGGAKAKASP